ncbi:RNA polymerase sigma factor SigJ [Sandaracinus amylolyticus]|uniref:RNA polymerase sigma-70 factor, ECF subfamily n=1 Tax=Sandaracinus amylolyticus TaxID=927083 RepID=A0A0F6W7N5_9BACT|nr:RNA polymerase sigma factor SigJ [Sandaracinus amylolyticus]AKF09517.1 RNA polymerase sigma-70 factor, ECF subfamily [Sandaracinus amylolyticus]
MTDDPFTQARPMLLGLAYRILGSRADAEDAVQDTYVKWLGAHDVESPAAWLTATCTRRCIDMLRSAHRSRVDYVGPWLPEPLHTPADEPTDASLASSLGTAFLLVLERLTPKERAAYLLHEVFDVSYAETARTLEINETACRKLVSRARTHVEQAKVRHVTPRERQDELLAAFEVAITSGELDRLSALLADDVELRADGGGKVSAIREPLHGKQDVLAFVRQLAAWWRDYEWIATELNGGRGVVLRANGTITTSLTFAYDEAGAVTQVFIVRNPDKLAALVS